MQTETTGIREITEAELRQSGGGAGYLKIGDIAGEMPPHIISPKLQPAFTGGLGACPRIR